MSDEIVKVLDELGNRLGPTAQAAWHILVGQAFAENLTGVIAGTLLLVTGVVIIIATVIGVVKSNDDSWFMIGLLGLVPLVFGGGLLFASLPGLIFPEGAALKNLIEILK